MNSSQMVSVNCIDVWFTFTITLLCKQKKAKQSVAMGERSTRVKCVSSVCFFSLLSYNLLFAFNFFSRGTPIPFHMFTFLCNDFAVAVAVQHFVSHIHFSLNASHFYLYLSLSNFLTLSKGDREALSILFLSLSMCLSISHFFCFF